MAGPMPDPTVRARLLDAADRLLVRRGYRHMTIEQIAVEAAVGKGSVYLHFPSKAALALACIDRMAERVHAQLERIAARPASAATRLRAMLHARVLERFDYASGHAASLDALLADIRAPLLLHRAAQFRAESALLARVLEEGGRAGTLRRLPKARARSAAAALITATNALLPYSLSAGELGRRPELTRRLRALADVLLFGLTAAQPARNPSPQTRRRSSR